MDVACRNVDEITEHRRMPKVERLITVDEAGDQNKSYLEEQTV
jgi:hypothetical protein